MQPVFELGIPSAAHRWLGLLSALLLLSPSQAHAIPVCGDGVTASNEYCDDGNHSNGDGCSAICWVEPGFVCAGEPSSCTAPVCGDGIVSEGEDCDDAGTDGGDGCSAACQAELGWALTETPQQMCGGPAVRLGGDPTEWGAAESTARAEVGAWTVTASTHPIAWDYIQAAGDLDNDGDPDWFFTGLVWWGTGDGFIRSGDMPCWGVGANPEPSSTIVDLDGDGLRDLLIGTGEVATAGNAKVMMATAPGAWAPCTGFSLAPDVVAVYDLAAGDLDDDGVLDVAVAQMRTEEEESEISSGWWGGSYVQTCFGTGGGGLDCALQPDSYGGREGNVAIADFDGVEGREVLYGMVPTWSCNPFCNAGSSYPPKLCAPAAGCLELGPPVTDPGEFSGYAVGDFDGDEDLDFVVANQTIYGSGLAVDYLFRNDGSGNFDRQTLQIEEGTADTGDYQAFDADGDGDLDLLRWVDYSASTVSGARVCINDGAAMFTCGDALPDVEALNIGPATVTSFGEILDIDQDGDLDLLLSAESQVGGAALPFFNNGSGSFTIASPDDRPYRPEYAHGWSDALTVDLLDPSLLDLGGASTTRVLIQPNRATALQPPDTEVIWWARPGDRAPIPISDNTVTVLPVTEALSLHAELYTEDEFTTPWIEDLQVWACQGPEDADGDGCDDLVDPSPNTADTLDTDGDGLPDVCDSCDDPDGDGVPTASATGDVSGCLAPAGVYDADPSDQNVCVSSATDPLCDHCSPGWYHPRFAGDLDEDGLCADADLDDDGDGCEDTIDSRPGYPDPDLDGDGICNEGDEDQDGDGCLDTGDHDPWDPNNDADGDGLSRGSWNTPGCDNSDGNPCSPAVENAACQDLEFLTPTGLAPGTGDLLTPESIVVEVCCGGVVDPPSAWRYEFALARSASLGSPEYQWVSTMPEGVDELTYEVPSLDEGRWYWSVRTKYGERHTDWWTPNGDGIAAWFDVQLPADDDDATQDDDDTLDDDDTTSDDDDIADDDDSAAPPAECQGCSLSSPGSAGLLGLLALGLTRRRRLVRQRRPDRR